MAGLPKKYAKMGFKKGWREYRKVHPKSGKKRKSSAPKKKTTKRRSPSRPRPKGGNKTTTKKKMTQGDIHMGHAVSGPAIQKFLLFAEDSNPGHIQSSIPQFYTGFDPTDRSFEIDRLARGWGGTVNEVAYRKLAQALHTTPYPSRKSFLEMLACYGKPIMDIWANQDDIQEAHRLIYADLHGVDLGKSGFDAWQPGEMIDTKGTLLIVKMIKKYAREAGVNLPKWM